MDRILVSADGAFKRQAIRAIVAPEALQLLEARADQEAVELCAALRPERTFATKPFSPRELLSTVSRLERKLLTPARPSH